MSNILDKNVSFLASIAVLAPLAAGIAVVGTELSAQAEIIVKDKADVPVSLSVGAPQQPKTATLAPETKAVTPASDALVAPIVDLVTSSSPAKASGSENQHNLQMAIPVATKSDTTGTGKIEPQQLKQATPTQEGVMLTAGYSSEPRANAYAPAPVPGTTVTSAAPLTTSRTPQITPAETADSEVAQVDIDPGTPTFGGDSYIGLAGNIGLTGDSALGDSSFMVISKIGLTTRIAVRPSVAIENDPVILVPVTFDFSLRPIDAFTERLPIAPYVGGGIAFSTGDNSDVGPMVTAGVDFPISPQFTATAAVNAAFLEEADVGLLVGIGYNFSAFGL